MYGRQPIDVSLASMFLSPSSFLPSSLSKKKEKVVYPHDGILVTKRHEALTPTAVWMTLENMAQSERRQTEEDNYCRFYLHELFRIGKFTQTDSGLVRSYQRRGGGGRGHGSNCLVGMVSAWDDERVLETGSGDDCTFVCN